ncbi:transferase, partial [Streptomyces solincola]
MRIGLLTEGGYPYARGESALWCDRLTRGLAQHEYDVYALTRTARQERAGRMPTAPSVRSVRTAALWTPAGSDRAADRGYGRRERRLYAHHMAELAAGVCAGGEYAAGEYAGGQYAGGERGPAGGERAGGGADAAFAAGLYGLADLAREYGAPPPALRYETAVRAL